MWLRRGLRTNSAFQIHAKDLANLSKITKIKNSISVPFGAQLKVRNGILCGVNSQAKTELYSCELK